MAININWGHVILDCLDGSMEKAIIIATNFDANKTKEDIHGNWFVVELLDRNDISLIKFKYHMYNNNFKLLDSFDLENYDF